MAGVLLAGSSTGGSRFDDPLNERVDQGVVPLLIDWPELGFRHLEDAGEPGIRGIGSLLQHAGKFGGGSYKVSGGLHGVGVSAVNALSEWCVVEVSRDGKFHQQRYERGYPTGPVQVIGKTHGTQTGTKTTFRFDTDIFKGDLDYRFETLVQRLREMAFVTRGVTIFLQDDRSDPEMTFYFEGGITSFVRYLNP